MSVPENEAMAGRADTSLSCQQYGDCEVISNSVSASLDVNPFVGEGGAYDSVRPAYPDEAVAALIDAAQRARRENMPGRGGPLRAADIGAGTGKMSELLARGGLLVDAVEPSKAMPWVHRLTRIMRSGDVHRPDRPPMPGGGFAPMTLTQVAWEDRMTPEEILTLGTTRSSYIRSSEAGKARMQENLRWYLYDHLGYAPGEQVTIPYATLVWLTHL